MMRQNIWIESFRWVGGLVSANHSLYSTPNAKLNCLIKKRVWLMLHARESTSISFFFFPLFQSFAWGESTQRKERLMSTTRIKSETTKRNKNSQEPSDMFRRKKGQLRNFMNWMFFFLSFESRSPALRFSIFSALHCRRHCFLLCWTEKSFFFLSLISLKTIFICAVAWSKFWDECARTDCTKLKGRIKRREEEENVIWF